MSIIGGLEEKIKIITIDNKIIDIEFTDINELDLKYEDNEFKSEFINLAIKIQRLSFLYSLNYELPNTILLRNLLFNPACYPIIDITNKDKDLLYTRIPIRKKTFTKNYDIWNFSSEKEIYVLGIIIDKQKYGSILFDYEFIESKFIVPEYNDKYDIHKDNYLIYFFKNKDINKLLLSLLEQLQYSVYFYNLTNKFKYEEIEEYKEYKKQEEFKIISWYSDKEIKVLKYFIESWTYNLEPLEKLNKNWDVIYYGLIEGYNSIHITNYFNAIEIEKNRLKAYLLIENEKTKYINMSKRYIDIIKNKIGSDIYIKIIRLISNVKSNRLVGGSMAIPKTIIDVNDPDIILNLLTKKEQEIVKVEYNRQEQYMLSYYKNKCPHLNEYKKMIQSKNQFTTKLHFNNLITYFDNELSNDLEWIVCNNCNFNIMCKHVYDKIVCIISNLSDGQIIDKLMSYAVKIKFNKMNKFYCKICGEILIQDYFIQENVFKPKSMIYISKNDSEIKNYTWHVILNILKEYTDDSYINENKFANFISNEVYPLIEKNIVEFDDNAKIIIILFIHAYMLEVIKIQKISFFNIKNEQITSNIVKKILSYTFTKYENLIIKTKNNTESIKNEFISIYKKIFNNKLSTNVPVNNMETNLINYIFTIDPIYNYAKYIYSIYKNIQINNETDIQKIKKNFELIIGNSLPNIIKEAKENSKNKKYVNIIYKRFGIVMQYSSLKFFYNNKHLNLYRNLISIDEKLITTFLNGSYHLYKYISYILYHKYLLADNDEDYEEFQKLLSKVRNIENKLFNKLKLIDFPRVNIMYEKDAKFIETKVYISDLYDKNAVRHKWKYNKDNQVDICTICNIKRNETSTLDNDKIWDMFLRINFDIDPFFLFYKIKCPIESIHLWENNKCSKCEITISMLNNVIIKKYDSDILDYYNKYLVTFNKEQEEIKKNNVIEKEINNNIKHIQSSIESIQYEYNYTIVVTISKLFTIDINLIESIGLTENRLYTEVIQNINTPEVDIHHVYAAYAELIFILHSYFNQIDNKDIKFFNYVNDFNIILYSYPLSTVHKYIIQSICELLFYVYDINKELAQKIINEVIYRQKLFSLPKTINWKLMEDDDDEEDSNNIVYLGDDIGDNGEDIYHERILKGGNNTRSLYYSSKNIDYDFTEDNPNNELNKDYPNEYIFW